MIYFDVFAQELAAIFIFFYSIERFSHMILRENLEKIKKLFARIANTNLKATLTGFVATIILQSSTAVSTLSVTMTNAGVFSIAMAMPIIFGAGIGTSSTALLVSLKWKSMEEVTIIIGAVLTIMGKKNHGRVLFYLGLLLFSIEQMSIATSVLKDAPVFKYIFSEINNIFLLFIVGIIMTIVLQSSSLVTSILVILILQNGIDMRNAMILCIGAFVGTTLTALIVAIKMNNSARTVAILNSGLSLIAGSINLVFVGFFIEIGSMFKNQGFGLAIGNSMARVFSALMCLGMFILWNNKGAMLSKVKSYKKQLIKKIKQ